MSLNRLRKLAGLKESFTSDPELNADIEAKVSQQSPEIQNIWMDILEFIYQANKTVSKREIYNYIEKLHPEDITKVFATIMKSLEKEFTDFVIKTPEGYTWNNEGIDPNLKAAIGSQVDATYTALQLMREMTVNRGGFTKEEFIREFSNRLHVPIAMIAALTEHLMTQFQSMLVKNGNKYSIKVEHQQTRDDTMSLFRELERNPDKNIDNQ